MPFKNKLLLMGRSGHASSMHSAPPPTRHAVATHVRRVLRAVYCAAQWGQPRCTRVTGTVGRAQSHAASLLVSSAAALVANSLRLSYIGLYPALSLILCD